MGRAALFVAVLAAGVPGAHPAAAGAGPGLGQGTAPSLPDRAPAGLSYLAQLLDQYRVRGVTGDGRQVPLGGTAPVTVARSPL